MLDRPGESGISGGQRVGTNVCAQTSVCSLRDFPPEGCLGGFVHGSVVGDACDGFGVDVNAYIYLSAFNTMAHDTLSSTAAAVYTLVLHRVTGFLPPECWKRPAVHPAFQTQVHVCARTDVISEIGSRGHLLPLLVRGGECVCARCPLLIGVVVCVCVRFVFWTEIHILSRMTLPKQEGRVYIETSHEGVATFRHKHDQTCR